jgi:hypothetical protein
MHWHLVQFQLVSRQPFDDVAYLDAWVKLNGEPPLNHPTINLDDDIGIERREEHDQKKAPVSKTGLRIKISHWISKEKGDDHHQQSGPQRNQEPVQIIFVRDETQIVGQGEDHLQPLPRDVGAKAVLEQNGKRNQKEYRQDHEGRHKKEEVDSLLQIISKIHIISARP